MAERQLLRVLIVEDRESDAHLVLQHLKQAGFEPRWLRVEDEPAFVAALNQELDVILADFHMPAFGAQRALEVLKEHGVQIPLIVVSGSIGEEMAVELLQGGATDYLLKDRLQRLGAAVQRSIELRRGEVERRRVEDALHEVETRTRFALNAARVGVWEIDLQKGTARWSETLEALHGLEAGTFGGTFQAFLDRVHADDREDVAKAIDDATRQRTDSSVTYRTEWPDGTTHWINATGKTFYDDGGTPGRAAGISLDVTEQRLLEEQQRQSQKVEALGRLAGGIAHDFNNLLTAIQGYGELLRHALGAESPHQDDLSEIRQAATRAAALTQQLLAFGRRQILEPRIIELRDSVRGMESMLRRLIGEDLNMVVRTTNAAARVKADPSQIEQVILNLALNARDAMPEGGSLLVEVVTVDLDDSHARQHASMRPGPHVMLSVSDTGVGMDAATQARIFEPFFTTKEKGRGTGLGLSTVYGIVKQTGGHIWVYSEPGRGTTFKVCFPRVDASVEPPPPPPPTDVLTGAETILVVEDEPGVRELVRKVLARYGYRVLVAAAPREALVLAERYGDLIHLLVTDVILPEMSGHALAMRMVTERPAMQVLYMSGYTDDAIVHHGVLLPDTPFIQKPFTPQALARKVRAVLN
jgi:two-component system, cell cycle sensor histidine kinase and response regulator CckA